MCNSYDKQHLNCQLLNIVIEFKKKKKCVLSLPTIYLEGASTSRFHAHNPIYEYTMLIMNGTVSIENIPTTGDLPHELK